MDLTSGTWALEGEGESRMNFARGSMLFGFIDSDRNNLIKSHRNMWLHSDQSVKVGNNM